MEYRWSIYGGRTEKQRSFLQGKALVLREKNQEREKRKIPHRQGIHEGVGIMSYFSPKAHFYLYIVDKIFIIRVED